ncbi:MAG: endolytic transglycosylase MltG [Lachnospiraceae bacterium]|nr:endolytic transglycosylase MltG [Lachnospiraceae bacterium]
MNDNNVQVNKPHNNMNNGAANQMNADKKTTGRNNSNGNSSNKRRPKKKTRWDEIIRKGLKHSAGFMFSLLINIVIVFFIIRMFSYSFNFAYSVFGDVAKDPSGREYAVIEIPADSSTFQIGKALEDNEIIEDKYVFWAKVRIKNLGGKIKAGKYGLSSSMTYEEIINLICGINDEDDEED